jgi:hypothetical protein
MIDILGNLITLYLEPIFQFVGIYIDSETCELKPANIPDKSIVFKYEDKDVIVVKSDGQFNKFKDKKDIYEIFNPFLVPKHMIFLVNLVKNRLNELVEPKGNKNVPLEYDEDLDTWIIKDDKINIEDVELYNTLGVFQRKVHNIDEIRNTESDLIEVAFCYVDKSGNSVEPFVYYQALEPIMAMYGACLEAIKKFTKVIPIHLRNTENAGNAIYLGLSHYEKERLKYGKELTGFQGLDMSSQNEGFDPSIWDKIEFRMENDNVYKHILPKSLKLNRLLTFGTYEEMLAVPNFWDYYYLPELKLANEEETPLFVSNYQDLTIYDAIELL